MRCSDFAQSQWGCSHLEIRLGRSGCHQHSCDGQFGYLSLFDLVGAYTGETRAVQELSLVAHRMSWTSTETYALLYSHNNLSLLHMIRTTSN